jgi:GNAT superfamily N-acetyltransferase
MMSKTSIVRLNESQVADAGAAMARAFFNDALAIYMFPDEDERRRLRPWHFITFIRYGCLFGEVYTTEDRPDGVAVCFPPGQVEMPPEKMSEVGFDRAPDMLGVEAWRRFIEVDAFIEQYHSREVREPHWYLALIGVDTLQQQRGIGSALLRRVHIQADEQGLASYLWTVGPQNVPFYQHNGYEVITEDIEPISGIRFWTCLRKPTIM